MTPTTLTPVEEIDGMLVKRDDLFMLNCAEGLLFNSQSDADAKNNAYIHAWHMCRDIDNHHPKNIDEYLAYPRYVKYAYKLFYKGGLVEEYAPPTLEDIEAGRVRIYDPSKNNLC